MWAQHSIPIQRVLSEWELYWFLCPLDSDISCVFSRTITKKKKVFFWSCEKNCIYLYVIEKTVNVRMVISSACFNINKICFYTIYCTIQSLDFIFGLVNVFVLWQRNRKFVEFGFGFSFGLMCACVCVCEISYYFYIIFFFLVVNGNVCDILSKFGLDYWEKIWKSLDLRVHYKIQQKNANVCSMIFPLLKEITFSIYIHEMDRSALKLNTQLKYRLFHLLLFTIKRCSLSLKKNKITLQ